MRISMNFKKLLWPMFCGMLAMTVACSSDSTTPTDPNTPPGGDPATPGTNPGGNGGAYVSPVALATSANKDAAATIANKWAEGHFVSMETESGYYGSVASGFKEVFTGYSPVGRIIWSGQSTGTYKNKCSVTDATVPLMKFRGCTVSEGIGYGMLISYFKGDDVMFNSLWNYSRGFRQYFSTPFTPWITFSFHYNQIDISSATDADLDIATALILMYYRTGGQDYLNDAMTIVNAIWDQEIEKSSKLILSGYTNMWTTNPTFNLSYFSPVALRLFATVDQNPAHDWNGVLDAMYAYMKKVQDGGTGVFPDWSDAAGAAKNAPNSSSDKTYWLFDKESVRIPWRIAWDYYWYQEPRAQAILNTLNEFIVKKSGGDVNNVTALGTNYSWNLSVGADKADMGVISSQWLGAWCATGLAGNADWLNACTSAVNAREPTNNASSYFSDILLTMYAQLLNGVFVRPF